MTTFPPVNESFLMRGTGLLAFWALIAAAPARGQERKLELVVQTGHTGSVLSVAYSPDGNRVVTAGQDSSPIVWDALSGDKLRSLSGHTGQTVSVAWSADGRRILSGAWDNTAILWDALTGAKLRVFTGHTLTVNCATLGADGSRVLTGAMDKTAILWDGVKGTKLRTFVGHSDHITAVALSADGSRVLTGSWDKTAILWDAATGAKLQTFSGHTKMIYSVALGGDGTRVLTGSGDRTAILWNAKTGEKLRTFAGHKDGVRGVALSADGGRVLAGSWDKTASLWDAKTGEKLRTFTGHGDYIYSVAMRADGARILTGGGRKKAVEWDARTGEILRVFAGHTATIHSVAASPDGTRVVTANGVSNSMLWETAGGRKPEYFLGHEAAWSADGSRILTGQGAKSATLWDANTGEKLRKFEGHASAVHALALTANGNRVLTGSQDETAILWDGAFGLKLRTFAGHTMSVHSVALSGDGKRVLTGSYDRTAVLWDANTGQKIRTLDPSAFSGGVALNGDGSRAITGSTDGSAVLWDANTGVKLRAFAGHTDRIICLAASPDGDRFVTGSRDKTALLWDAKTGKKLMTFAGHQEFIFGVAMSGDGNRVLTGSSDGTTRIWNARTGREICSLIGIDSGKDWLVTTPDGIFDGSPGAGKFVSYRINGTMELVPLERYQEKFWVPGLFGQLMAGKAPKPAADLNKTIPPKVVFDASLKPGMEVKSGKLTVRASAETRGDYPVKRFRLMVDGSRGSAPDNVQASPKLGTSYVSWSVDLPPGEHRLKVFAETEYVQGASEEITVRYVGGGAAPKLPSLYVLAIGVSAYPDATRKLEFAHLDAEAVAAACKTHSKGLFQEIDAKVLTDSVATRKGIFQGLQWLGEKMAASPNAVGLLFFAGHGEKGPKDGLLYFLPVDFKENDFAGSAMNADTLKKQFAGMPGRKMLILDACHSGDIGKEKTRSGGELTDRLLRDLTAEENGLIVMCSALGNQKAMESREHKHGMFTLAFLEALEGKAAKTEGAVYLDSVNAYVNKRVGDLSKGYQSPVAGRPLSIRDFPLSKP